MNSGLGQWSYNFFFLTSRFALQDHHNSYHGNSLRRVIIAHIFSIIFTLINIELWTGEVPQFISTKGSTSETSGLVFIIIIIIIFFFIPFGVGFCLDLGMVLIWFWL